MVDDNTIVISSSV